MRQISWRGAEWAGSGAYEKFQPLSVQRELLYEEYSDVMSIHENNITYGNTSFIIRACQVRSIPILQHFYCSVT